MMAYEISAPRAVTTFTSDDLHVATDPSAALRPSEQMGLRWFFGEHESDLGMRSTFGAQLDAALAQRISDESMQDARMMKALKTKLRKGWQPGQTKAKRAKRRSPITEVFLDHVGISVGAIPHPAPEVVDAGGRVSAWEAYRRGLDIADLSDQTIYMHAPMHSPPADPFENDRILFLVRKAHEIRKRLVLVGENHTKVLNAVYGPSTHGEGREALRKRFGELVEIVVAIVASQRGGSDPPARAIVRAKLSDDSFVRMFKHGASAYLRASAQAYAETRS